MIHAQVSSISSPSGCCSDQIFIQNPNFSPKSKTLISLPNRNHFPKALFRICKASLGYRNGEGADDDGFLQASLLVSGEFAISQLIGALSDDQHEECPDQLQFAKNIVLKFGYEVNMVRITERIVNTYQACIYLGKHPKDVNISINARPSDAINVAERFKAPIYVSKEIVLKDAIKIVYGKWRGSGKTVYDVSLDSAVEGHDPLAEEIYMIQKMKTAVLEERYEHAAMWRDKIANLRMQSQEL